MNIAECDARVAFQPTTEAERRVLNRLYEVLREANDAVSCWFTFDMEGYGGDLDLDLRDQREWHPPSDTYEPGARALVVADHHAGYGVPEGVDP